MKVSAPPISATRTSQNAARSASFWPGALEFCASCTSSTIWASAVSAPTFVARTRRVPLRLIVAPITSRPAPCGRAGSRPVTIDSSTSLSPSSTAPSTAIFEPGRTSSRSPTTTSAVGTSTGLAVAEHDRRRRSEVEQRADRVVRPAARSHLEPVAEQHERGQHAGRLVEHLAATGEGHADRVEPAGADRDRDQDHHVERPRPQRPHRADEEDRARIEDHRQAQQERPHVVAQPERRRDVEAEDVATDRRPQHDRDREERGDQEAVAHVGDHRRPSTCRRGRRDRRPPPRPGRTRAPAPTARRSGNRSHEPNHAALRPRSVRRRT